MKKKSTAFKVENLIILLPEKVRGPGLLINGHVDTLPLSGGWSVDPCAGIEKEVRLYGLGALDMKAGIAAAVFVFEAFVEVGICLKGDLLFTAVSYEEGSCGLGTHFAIMDGITNGCQMLPLTCLCNNM